MSKKKEVLSEFKTSDLENIIAEFFNNHVWSNFVSEVVSAGKINDTMAFYRNFMIDVISDEVSEKDLIEHEWCSEDEFEDD